MKKTLLTALLVMLGFMSTHATVVNYTADTAIFRNPERGFLTQLTRHANDSRYAVVGKESYLSKHADKDKGTLILVLYYLDEYNNTATLPDSILTAMNEDMQVLRNYGMKAIFRVAYAEDGNGLSGNDRSAADAPLSIIKSHLAQFKTFWAANTDVIYVFQAGFVGQYGEWYYTDNFGNHVEHINADCRALLDTVLNALPQNRFLQLRRPMFKQEYLDGVALTAEEAFTGTKKARLGHFNDAFLYHANNMGTYSDTSVQKPFIAQETLYVPIGGETDITDADQAATEASHDATVAEMSRLHWTFIKSGYSETVTNMWRENGTFNELNRNLGYRYELVSANLPETANAGDQVNISLNIKNVGYAPLYNERHAYIVLKRGGDTYSIQLATDPRRWLPNGVVTAINEQITIPAGVPKGTYNLYLHMPDIYPSLAGDSRYSIRFANEGVWQKATGMNRLMATITIGGGEPEETDPEVVALTDSLNKANVSDYSDNIGWYNSDYFDLGMRDADNTDHWIKWRVNLASPGKYVVSEVSYCSNSHNYTLQLLDGNNVVAEYTTKKLSGSSNVQNVTHTEKWDLTKVPAGEYVLRVNNATSWGRPKLKALKIDLFGAVSTETVNLPGTLTKANVADYSNNMLWYNNTYLDFATGGHNLDAWAKWKVNVIPGQYIISVDVEFGSSNAIGWNLVLFNGADTVATYSSIRKDGHKQITYDAKWDLRTDIKGNNIVKGIYTLEVKNNVQWATPKLQSLTLDYDGVLPTGLEEQNTPVFDGQAYDLLGRPVGDSYHGVVIQNGKKRIQ